MTHNQSFFDSCAVSVELPAFVRPIAGQFTLPRGLAIDSQVDGNVSMYVSDASRNAIWKVTQHSTPCAPRSLSIDTHTPIRSPCFSLLCLRCAVSRPVMVKWLDRSLPFVPLDLLKIVAEYRFNFADGMLHALLLIAFRPLSLIRAFADCI